jgi:hypothetical protein
MAFSWPLAQRIALYVCGVVEKRQKMPHITYNFPIEFVNAIVHKEVQGKKPIYNLHRWWARREGTTFRMVLLTALSRELDLVK